VAELDPPSWPPAPIRTARLVLRESEPRDRAAFIRLFASAEVHTYLGGAAPLADLERSVLSLPGRRPGSFVVELDGAMVGLVTLDRREPTRPGHLAPEGNEAELGYLFLPEAWGHGYAVEACRAVLAWFARTLPGEPVVLRTQLANEASMRLAAKLGFTEVARFEEYGAAQWFGAITPPVGPAPADAPG
jgi:RimJ/RimL family protein N-acetyltransferase